VPLPIADSEAACVAAEAEAVALGAQIDGAQRTVDTMFGDVGHEFFSTDPIGLKHRDSFFSLADGTVLRLGFASVFDTDDDGVEVILEGFEAL
jgi:hypothetical protein